MTPPCPVAKLLADDAPWPAAPTMASTSAPVPGASVGNAALEGLTRFLTFRRDDVRKLATLLAHTASSPAPAPSARNGPGGDLGDASCGMPEAAPTAAAAAAVTGVHFPLFAAVAAQWLEALSDRHGRAKSRNSSWGSAAGPNPTAYWEPLNDSPTVHKTVYLVGDHGHHPECWAVAHCMLILVLYISTDFLSLGCF
jgi:hypothetical protein